MQRPPELTDRAKLRLNRRRARRGGSGGMFLQEEAATELSERQGLVNRAFTAQAVITPFPEIWAQRLPNARIVSDEETLDLETGAHDLVIHALCLHWSNDPVGQLIQCRRALRPDGLFLGALFGGQTLVELRAALAEAEAEVSGGLSPRVAPMAEIRDAGGLLQRAGFALPVADSVTQTVTYADPLALMRDLRAMGEANALAGRLRRFTPRRVIETAAARYRAAFAGPEGRIRATFETIYLAGWAPDVSQPQPLRPGSAQARLAEALGVDETPAGEAAPIRPFDGQ